MYPPPDTQFSVASCSDDLPTLSRQWAADFEKTVRLTPKFTAVVMAGSRPGGDLFAYEHDQEFKALISLRGRAMIAHVVDALTSSGSIGNVIIVFEDADYLRAACPELFAGDRAERVRIVPCQPTICESVSAAIETAKAPWPVLVTTADHPVLTPEIVDGFCRTALAMDDSDLIVGLARRERMEAQFPDTIRTYIGFRDTGVSGCNLFALLNERAEMALDFWRNVENLRKKPWRLFAAFGPGAFFSFLFRRLTLKSAFERASRVIGINVKPVCLPWAEAAIDVDKTADLEMVTRILETRERRGRDAIAMLDSPERHPAPAGAEILGAAI